MTTQSPSTRETRTWGRRRGHTEIVIWILGVKAPTSETDKARVKEMRGFEDSFKAKQSKQNMN